MTNPIDSEVRKARVRYTADQLNSNPDFTLPMHEIMPLVEEVDALFAQQEAAAVEKASAIERYQSQADAIDAAREAMYAERANVEAAYDAYRTAQVALKQAEDVKEVTRITEATTAVQVAQASYELSGTEYFAAEKAYMDLVNAATPRNIAAEVSGKVPTGNAQDDLAAAIELGNGVSAGSVQ